MKECIEEIIQLLEDRLTLLELPMDKDVIDEINTTIAVLGAMI